MKNQGKQGPGGEGSSFSKPRFSVLAWTLVLWFGKDVPETPERRERGVAAESRGEWMGRVGIFPLGGPLPGVEGILRIETLTTQVVSVPSSVLRSFGASLCVEWTRAISLNQGC